MFGLFASRKQILYTQCTMLGTFWVKLLIKIKKHLSTLNLDKGLYQNLFTSLSKPLADVVGRCIKLPLLY